MEVLKEFHFCLQMGNCPIPVAENSGQYRIQKILHSQLHLVNMFLKILERCDQSPSEEETFQYFKHVTMTKTEYENHIDKVREQLDPSLQEKNEEVSD